jgi:DNA/RNA endonuclease YhcR with UshA esterase domain
VYYGYFLTSIGKKVLSVGNRVRIVGSAQYYETGKSYQISDLQYDPFDLTTPNNIQKLDDEKHDPYYAETTVEQFHSEVTVDLAEESKTLKYAELALGTTVEMKNLVVESMYTTNNDGANDGAISITCKVGEQTITVRTVVLKDANGELITQDYFRGKTIDVKGVIDTYNGAYQVKLFSLDDVVVHQTNAN